MSSWVAKEDVREKLIDVDQNDNSRAISRESRSMLTDSENNDEWENAQSNVSISLDLISAAKEELRFLAMVERTPALQHREVLDRAVDRYLSNWLPLLFRFRKEIANGAKQSYLIPPFDCAWIWHSHMLNPVKYKRDCQEKFGLLLLDVKPLPYCESSNTELWEDVERASIERWETAYPEEAYHFVQRYEDGKNSKFQELLASKQIAMRSYDPIELDNLVDAALRHSQFYYQVSAPWFSDSKFLLSALQRYKGFLYLMRKGREAILPTSPLPFLVPTYDIDLLWHSHQQSPLAYLDDTVSLLGILLDHDDSSQDRSAGEKLAMGFLKTCEQWRATFGTVYEHAGAMYRGSPSSPAPPAPTIFDKREMARFTKNGSWNPDPFNEVMELETNELKLDDVNVRLTTQVLLAVIGARNIETVTTHSTSDIVTKAHVRLTSTANLIPNLTLETKSRELDYSSRSSGGGEVQWNQGRYLEVEMGTKGLKMQLICSHYRKPQKSRIPRFLRNCACYGGDSNEEISEEFVENSDKIFGEIDILWSDLLKSPSSFTTTKWSSLSGCTTGVQVPQIHYSVSMTPFVTAPKLFSMVRSPVTDDHRQVVEPWLLDEIEKKPEGLWITKTVLDHLGSEKFVVRTRYADAASVGKYEVELGRTDLNRYQETVIEVIQFNGSLKDCSEGRVVGTARQLMKSTHHSSFKSEQKFRYWSLFDDGAILIIQQLNEDKYEYKFTINGECGPHPMRLLSGARLQFQEGREVFKEGTITLVRYTSDAPLGTATAFIDLYRGTLEVMQGESTVLALLLASAIYKSMFDFHDAVDSSVKWLIKESLTEAYQKFSHTDAHTHDGQIGAMVLRKGGLSSLYKPLDIKCGALGYPRWLEIFNENDWLAIPSSAGRCSGTACGGYQYISGASTSRGHAAN